MGFSSIFRGACVALITIMFALVLSTCGGERKAPSSGLSALNAESSGPPAELEDSRGKAVLGGSEKPVSVPGAFPTSGGVPLNVHFFDDGSYDPDGEIVKWEWNFADGGWHDYTETQGDAWHQYDKPGNRVGLLRVTDNDGKKDVGQIFIEMREGNNANPVAMANADPLSGTSPLAVSFNASGSYDPDGTIVKYEWDFDDGTGWEDFTEDEGIAEYTYTTGGLYTAILRVTDDDGAMSTASKEIDVNSPPVAVANADPTEGNAPLTVSFSAEGSSDSDGTIIKYEWDFDEGADWEDFTPTTGAATHDYTTAGNYTATLRITDDDGAEDTDNSEIEVLNPATWHIAVVDSYGNVGLHSHLTVVNGYPAIAYFDYGNWDLKYVRASDEDGITWGTPLTIAAYSQVGGHPSLVVVNGNPAISYYDYTRDVLMYVRATDANGDSWGSRLTVDRGPHVGLWNSMAIVDGKPAISYYDYLWNVFDLKYVRANDADGSSWGTPMRVDRPGNVGRSTYLAIVNGNPAISYTDWGNGRLKFVRANIPEGSTWGSPQVVDNEGNPHNYWVGAFASLAVIDGNPAISYFDSTNCDLKYVRASDANGDSWESPEIVDSEGIVGYWASLAAVNGKPAISYYHNTNQDLKFAIYY
jgi:PKD repeat protein